jgi:copper homeostasis protein
MARPRRSRFAAEAGDSGLGTTWPLRGGLGGSRLGLLLEVIVQTVADAHAATEGGADRLEVVRAILDGGLTPVPSVVRAIAAATPLPLRVMVRENAGYDMAPGELPALRRAAEEFAAGGIDGLVIGFARGGEALLDDMERVLEAAPGARVTFHRAFDVLRDPLGTIPTLTSVARIDHILTSGGDGNAEARCNRLSEYAERAAPGIAIIAGGGVDEEALSLFARRGCVREVHVGRAAREGGNADGPVSAARVRHLKMLTL